MSNNNRRTQSMKNSRSEGFEEHGSKSYDGTCFCRLQMVVLKLKMRRNPGRWFFRCPLWKTKNTRCRYFQWMDKTYEESVGLEESSKNGTLAQDTNKHAQCTTTQVRRRISLSSNPCCRDQVRRMTPQVRHSIGPRHAQLSLATPSKAQPLPSKAHDWWS
ncbi:hypothetical protein Ahy_A07g035207 [Arachis hypogaea]|uniref:GRF-type domain-containing protein n=1 Tax=Arachis hypogaea TaxID=3818 RepID=A0A445CDG7_ARAHY|nr:hypothetical protein Ahy_A07g035207 [Arachis hypogaea]